MVDINIFRRNNSEKLKIMYQIGNAVPNFDLSYITKPFYRHRDNTLVQLCIKGVDLGILVEEDFLQTPYDPILQYQFKFTLSGLWTFFLMKKLGIREFLPNYTK